MQSGCSHRNVEGLHQDGEEEGCQDRANDSIWPLEDGWDEGRDSPHLCAVGIGKGGAVENPNLDVHEAC